MSSKQKTSPRASYRIPFKRTKVRFPKFAIKSRASEAGYRHRGPRGTCAYCGDRAECIDHAFPASWAQGATVLISSHQLIKLSSCHDCNSRAGAVVDLTFLDRRRRIADSVRAQHGRLMAIPDMDADELADMGVDLQRRIGRQQREAGKLRRRFAVLSSADRPEGVPANLIIAA